MTAEELVVKNIELRVCAPVLRWSEAHDGWLELLEFESAESVRVRWAGSATRGWRMNSQILTEQRDEPG